jgi:hypothetical protein
MTVKSTLVHRLEVETIDPRFAEDEDDTTDILFATWVAAREAPYCLPEHWMVAGDNTGEAQLVVYPYMIDGLIELLTAMKTAEPVVPLSVTGRSYPSDPPQMGGGLMGPPIGPQA